MHAEAPASRVIGDRYRLVGLLGAGGYAKTYAAEDLQTGLHVALKEVPLAKLKDWRTLDLVEREAKVLASLDHPAIPRYLDFFHEGTAEGKSFVLVQQIAEGTTLASLASTEWRGTVGDIRKMAHQLMEVLVYLHERTPPIIHRDIKPQNIIRRGDGHLFLVDFGAVLRLSPSSATHGGTVAGTYGFMAPEQMYGQTVCASDLYSVGMTLISLLTRVHPSTLERKELRVQFRNRASLSPQFANWLDGLVAPAIENRFPTARAALAALHRGEGYQPARSRTRLLRPKKIAWWTVPVLAMALAIPLRYRLTSTTHQMPVGKITPYADREHSLILVPTTTSWSEAASLPVPLGATGEPNRNIELEPDARDAALPPLDEDEKRRDPVDLLWELYQPELVTQWQPQVKLIERLQCGTDPTIKILPYLDNNDRLGTSLPEGT